MQKINSLEGYARVKEGVAVSFTTEEYLADQARRIKLRVNAPEEVRLFVTALPETFDEETGELTSPEYFLGYVAPGFEEFEFAFTGNFMLRAVGGEVWLDTYDSANFVVQNADDENYARVYERPEEDPLMTQMKFIARQNQRQRELEREQDRIEFERILAQRLAAREAANVIPPATSSATSETGTAAGSPAVGAPADNGASATPAGGATGEPATNGGT